MLYITTMISSMTRQYFNVFRDLSKTLRFFQSKAILSEKITLIQFSILDHINTDGFLEMSRLHQLLSVEKSTTTRLIQPLIQRGLIEKVQSQEDLRVYKLVITPDGIAVHATVWECISEFLERMMQNIPDDNREEVIKNMYVFIRSISLCCDENNCREEG